MGKIRVKVLGDEEQEQEKQKEAKIKKEQKQARKSASGEATSDAVEEVTVSPIESVEPKEKKVKKEKFDEKKKAAHSKSYQTIATLVDKTKTYSVADALALLPQLKRAKFDETVELHINTIEAGISGSVTLPHGTGKQLRVVIADDPTAASGQATIDALIKKIEGGMIDFDVLIAHPSMMPKLAKVAKVLGPKGLMPNPKNGTVSTNPEEAAKKFTGGLINYKTESKTPIIHMSVGKLSFGDKKLAENIKTVFATINESKIKNITIKSTMSPGIKISL